MPILVKIKVYKVNSVLSIFLCVFVTNLQRWYVLVREEEATIQNHVSITEDDDNGVFVQLSWIWAALQGIIETGEAVKKFDSLVIYSVQYSITEGGGI